ncbi:hypothetical protein ABB55_15500 [Prosthecomicrobium hirschii]|uniref:Uncharacterized protein n=1 Tax=Prosthecodimorpha hirschii TaxID=665126 RepID=A0A0P6VNN0_9HYPH|nr:hypothetical protein [Prosthecomicrobium hirschii]KPL53447.1 hypothetical protein ABB55_15500 [Prosthecomicrobium hirschii]
MLDSLFAGGRMADLALAALLVETLVSLWLARRLGRGPGVAAILCNAGAGAGLLLALRAALTGAGAAMVAAGLVFALVAHLGEVVLRWRRRDG